jgi:hypothetical protein
MRAIYQRASNTVIWLGPDKGDTRDAFSLVGDLYQRSLTKRTKRSTFLTGSVDLPLQDDKRWASLSRFLDLSWFERCWIIQEVVVSRGDPILLSGLYQALWSRFQEAMTWVSQHHSRFRTDRMKLLNAIFNLSSSGDVWELQSLLYSTYAFQATDARDKVFALFGLAAESRSPDSWPKVLMPNYNRSIRDVYTEVTLYCIRTTRTLSILSQVERTSDVNGDSDGSTYPSWVPRWNLPRLASSLNVYDVAHNASGWKHLTEKFNLASKRIPASIDPCLSPGVLRLAGLHISTVESCLPAVFPEKASMSASTTSLDSCVHPRILQSIPEWYELYQERNGHSSSEDLMRVFFLVTTAGLTPEHTDARQEPLTHFRSFLTSTIMKTPDSEPRGASMYSLRTAVHSSLSISTLTPSLSPPISTDSFHKPLPHRTRSSPSALSVRAESSYFSQPHSDPTRYTSALTPLLHRRLFFTSSGQLGLGPANMISGDVVVVLFGGKVPFVLRQVDAGSDGAQWRLVGECYVFGIMDGEMVEGRDERGVGKGLITDWFDLV